MTISKAKSLKTIFRSVKNKFSKNKTTINVNQIIAKLQDDKEFEIGKYARRYPDNLSSITTGIFRIEIVDEDKFKFEIIADEQGHNINSFNFYETFETKEKLYGHKN